MKQIFYTLLTVMLVLFFGGLWSRQGHAQSSTFDSKVYSYAGCTVMTTTAPGTVVRIDAQGIGPEIGQTNPVNVACPIIKDATQFNSYRIIQVLVQDNTTTEYVQCSLGDYRDQNHQWNHIPDTTIVSSGTATANPISQWITINIASPFVSNSYGAGTIYCRVGAGTKVLGYYVEENIGTNNEY